MELLMSHLNEMKDKIDKELLEGKIEGQDWYLCGESSAYYKAPGQIMRDYHFHPSITQDMTLARFNSLLRLRRFTPTKDELNSVWKKIEGTKYKDLDLNKLVPKDMLALWSERYLNTDEGQQYLKEMRDKQEAEAAQLKFEEEFEAKLNKARLKREDDRQYAKRRFLENHPTPEEKPTVSNGHDQYQSNDTDHGFSQWLINVFWEVLVPISTVIFVIFVLLIVFV